MRMLRLPLEALALIVVAGALGACGRDPKAHFTDVGMEVLSDSLARKYPTGGVALFDYDGDGWLDMYIPTGTLRATIARQLRNLRDTLYHNNGDGTFTDVTVEAGLVLDPPPLSYGTVAGDLDNDGDADLVVTASPFPSFRGTVLFRNNGDGTFTDVTEGSGILTVYNSFSATLGDIDRDGLLDLYITSFPDVDDYNPVSPDRVEAQRLLYRNIGGLRFEEVGVERGVRAKTTGYAATFVDLDQDGAVDLLLADCAHPPHYLHNRGDGYFEDIAEVSGFTQVGDWMGFAIGDYNEDGLFDVFITNMGSSAYFLPPGSWVQAWARMDPLNALYLGRPDGTWINVAGQVRVDTRFQVNIPPDKRYIPAPPMKNLELFEWGWGAVPLDYDNDGHEDFFYVGGVDELLAPIVGTLENGANPSRLFRNDGAGGFIELTEEAGLWNADVSGYILNAHGAAQGDLDHDGFTDLVVIDVPGASASGSVRVYRNGGNRHHWLEVKLVGDGVRDNRDGVGAIVKVTANKRTQVRAVVAGSSFASMGQVAPHFGLGELTSVEQVEVRWPSGEVSVVGPVDADQEIVITE
jgi:hypothetical protein